MLLRPTVTGVPYFEHNGDAVKLSDEASFCSKVGGVHTQIWSSFRLNVVSQCGCDGNKWW